MHAPLVNFDMHAVSKVAHVNPHGLKLAPNGAGKRGRRRVLGRELPQRTANRRKHRAHDHQIRHDDDGDEQSDVPGGHGWILGPLRVARARKLARSPERKRGAHFPYDSRMSGHPLAFLITWTCYGTWLPGDERGSTDDLHNLYGTPPAPADVQKLGEAEDSMTHAPMLLCEDSRVLVAATVREHCEFKRWTLHALNVRTNHVHVVVRYEGDPNVPLGQFKSWTTRRLREAGLCAPDQPVWTRRGSTRYLWKPEHVLGAIDYVMNRQ